jgi:hypothetical protein
MEYKVSQELKALLVYKVLQVLVQPDPLEPLAHKV